MSIIPRSLPGWFVLFGLLLMLVPPAAAATSGNQAEPASRVSPAAFEQTIRLSFASASDRFFYLVTTDGMSIGVAVADCCIAGDMWGAILLAPGRQIALAHNIDPATRTALPPGVFGPTRFVHGSQALVMVRYLRGIDQFPAGMDVKFQTPDGSTLTIQPLSPPMAQTVARAFGLSPDILSRSE